MKCPRCNNILIRIPNYDESITPYRQSDSLFPISIMVTIVETYKCNCGISINIPLIEYYECINKKPSKEK